MQSVYVQNVNWFIPGGNHIIKIPFDDTAFRVTDKEDNRVAFITGRKISFNKFNSIGNIQAALINDAVDLLDLIDRIVIEVPPA